MQDESVVPSLHLRIRRRRSIVPAGGDAAYVVRGKPVGGFQQRIAYSVIGLPSTLRAEFTGVTGRTGASAVLLIHTSTASRPGVYAFRVLAGGGGVSAVSLTTLEIRPAKRRPA
jgi:hypothetical protein